MTNKQAYIEDLNDILKEMERMLNAVPMGKSKSEKQNRKQAEEAFERVQTTISCMKRDYIIAE